MIEDSAASRSDDFELFEAAGLYDPSSPTASQRAELLGYLLGRFSVDEIVHWERRSNMAGVAARAIDRPPPLISADEAAVRAGFLDPAVCVLEPIGPQELRGVGEKVHLSRAALRASFP